MAVFDEVLLKESEMSERCQCDLAGRVEGAIHGVRFSSQALFMTQPANFKHDAEDTNDSDHIISYDSIAPILDTHLIQDGCGRKTSKDSEVES